MSHQELANFADKYRLELNDHIKKRGGHWGSNLSIIELTLSLLKNFDPKHNRYIFDTGYQSYLYKQLVDRPDFLKSIEENQKYSVFQEIDESEFDHYSGGHTSISAAWAAGYNLLDDDKKVIEIMGDASLSTSIGLGGLLNFAQGKKGLFILNDNKQGIGINKFNNLDWQKITEGMGYIYYEVIDGHDFDQLQKAWDFYKNNVKPTFVKVNTIKAKGADIDFDEKQALHYISSFNKEKEVSRNDVNVDGIQFMTSELNRRFDEDNDKCLFTAGMNYTYPLEILRKNHHNKVFDVGISEEIALIEAAAFANAGKTPYFMVFSSFFQRCYDQIIHDIIRNNSKVIIVVTSIGSQDDIAEIGDSHHGIYDVNMINGFQNFKIFTPSSISDLKLSMDESERYDGPSLIRLPAILNQDNGIQNLSWDYYNNKSNKVLITYGTLAFNRMKEYIESNNIHLDLVNAKTLNPIDKNLINKLIDENKKIFTYETVFWKNNLASSLRAEYKDKIFIDYSYNNSIIGRGNIEKMLRENNMDAKSVIDNLMKR